MLLRWETFKRPLVNNVANFNGSSTFPLSVKIFLFIRFAVQKKGRVLIADDMGLGKTIQAIAICNYYLDDWPVLIICPSSVKMSWQQVSVI